MGPAVLEVGDLALGTETRRFLCDPSSQDHARGTRASQLRSDHHRLLPSRRRTFFPVLSPFPRSVRSGTHPRVPGCAVQEVEVGAEHGEPTIGGAAFFLHPDAQEGLERGGNSVSEKDVPPAHDSQSRRGRSPDRLRPDPFSSHRAHDALRYRDAARRVGSLEDPRYRQSTNGHPHPRGQGAGRSRCHAQPQALGSFARVLAWAKTKALAVVVPGGMQPHRQSSHHSQSSLVRLSSRRTTGRSGSGEDSSAHAAPLFRNPLARSRSRPAHHSVVAGASRPGRNHPLPASFQTPSQRHRKPAGRARVVVGEGETPATANVLNEPASLGDGRSRSHRGAILPRTQSPLDDLATPESAAGHRTMPHRCARRSSRPVFPLRTFRHLLQLVSQSSLSKMPGQCPPSLVTGTSARVATHSLRARRFHSAAREWRNRCGVLFLLVYFLLTRREARNRLYRNRNATSRAKSLAEPRSRTCRWPRPKPATYTTGC